MLFTEWIEKRGTIEWPATSPNFTPREFRMWGLLKNKVFTVKLHSLEHIKELIAGHFDALLTLKLF